jgi:hypothetical protein
MDEMRVVMRNEKLVALAVAFLGSPNAEEARPSLTPTTWH